VVTGTPTTWDLTQQAFKITCNRYIRCNLLGLSATSGVHTEPTFQRPWWSWPRWSSKCRFNMDTGHGW